MTVNIAGATNKAGAARQQAVIVQITIAIDPPNVSTCRVETVSTPQTSPSTASAPQALGRLEREILKNLGDEQLTRKALAHRCGRKMLPSSFYEAVRRLIRKGYLGVVGDGVEVTNLGREVMRLVQSVHKC